MDELQEQWLSARLKARANLRFDVRTERSQSFVVVEDMARGKFFQIGPDEYKFILALDGKVSIQELIESKAVFLDESSPEAAQSKAIQICQWLIQNNLAFAPEADNTKRLNTQSSAVRRAKVMSWINPISCKIRLFNPNGFLTWAQPFTQWVFSRWVVVIWLFVGAYAISILYQDWDQMGAASSGILAGTKWVWLLVIWMVLKVVHETAHGIACRKYGGEVPEAGVLLLLFTPMAFVNVTSMWRFSNRWHRIIVAAAGMYVELFISFVSLIVWNRFEGVVGSIAFDVFIMSSVTTILFNANPLMRFDGYFMLSDLIRVPNLYTKGTKWFGDRLRSLFFGIPKTPNICTAAERNRIAVYGTLAFFWKITICFSLIIAASVLFYGAGIALAALGVVLWFCVPIYQQMRQVFGSNANQSNQSKSHGLQRRD